MPFSFHLRSAVVSLSLLGAALPGGLQAQTACKNQYPCGFCAVYDNNGNDLAGFVTNYRKQLDVNGGEVLGHSNNTWGYLLTRTVHVASVSSKWDTKGTLNHAAYIRTALTMNKSNEGDVATWWGRECNLDNGPLVQIPVKEEDKVDMKMERYSRLMSSLLPKKMVLVEYLDTFNARDYDYMVKNYIASKCGTIKPGDFEGFIGYYNNFLSKFTYFDDPVLSKMSFVTFYKGNSGTKYMSYFNVVNGKLAGRVETLDIEYAHDRDTVVKHTFEKLDGKVVYIYGDDSYGLDKTLIKYGKDHDLKLRRRTTDFAAKINDER